VTFTARAFCAGRLFHWEVDLEVGEKENEQKAVVQIAFCSG